MSKDLVTMSAGDITFSPQDFEQLERFGEMICKTSFVPSDMRGKVGDCIAAVMFGHEIGLAPLQALQNICVINGKPSVWGDAALGLVRSHPDFESIKETVEHTDERGLVAYCTIKRKGDDEVTQHFSQAEAQLAGLWSKSGPWKTYPRRMLQMRARSWAIRDVFPDAMKGLYLREEASDIVIESSLVEEEPPVAREAPRESPAEDLKAKLRGIGMVPGNEVPDVPIELDIVEEDGEATDVSGTD